MSTTQTTADTNPLLQSSMFPRFDVIRPEHVVPAMQQLLPELDAALQQLEVQAQPTWEGLVEPLERLTDRLSVTWGIVGHLMGVGMWRLAVTLGSPEMSAGATGRVIFSA
jgi:oligopeptidase A